MRYKIGVMGKAGKSRNLPDKIKKAAQEIGTAIAEKNCFLVSGACMGVADIAARSAAKNKGRILAFSPAISLKEHLEPPLSYPYPPPNTELIFTDLGKMGRNIAAVSACEAVIFIGGGIGTLNEFSIAYYQNKIIGILQGLPGIGEKIINLEKELKSGTAKETKAVIIKSKKARELVKKVIKEIEKKNNCPRKEIPLTFKNQNNKQLSGILHWPGIEKPALVIVCPGFQNNKTDKKIIRLARSLCQRNIAVFRFDFEGCGDSEGEPSQITVKQEAADLKAALEAVQSRADINPERLGFLGISLGSAVISLFLKKNKLKAKTLVFWSQAFKQDNLFKKWYNKEDEKQLKNKGVIYKKDKEIGKAYYLENKNKDYSYLLKSLKMPIFIIHGREDKDVPIELSQKLAGQYENISLLALPKANHKFENYICQKKLINQTLKWFKKCL